MYERPLYREDCDGVVLAFLRHNPLAMVVTSHDDVPVATHAPVLFRHGPDGADAEAVAAGTVPLAGSTLIGHMNVENPQWRRMRSGDRALIVFQGPHGYVSPTVYGVTPAAPTWDFIAVHVNGTVEPTADPAAVLDIVSDTARRLESGFGRGWDQESSLDYFRQIAPGVGAFTLRVDSVQTMFKLSQEKPAPMRRRVVEQFEASESGTHRALASVMRDRGLTEADEERETAG
uniref:Negative transcriptional regulator n=1 Tax=Streptomyces flaveolus TaxID=67297 RepID=D3U9Y3_9ACTN|nr:negative transcriptional regulator [Streptomyces flaveolus]QNJ99263.1 piperazate synthase [Shuttle vector pNATX13-XF36-RS26795]